MSVGGTELLHGGEGAVAPEVGGPGGGEIAARSPLNLFWRRFRQDKVAVAAGIVLILLGALFQQWGVMAPVLWVLAVLSTITVIHRIQYTYSNTKSMAPISQ